MEDEVALKAGVRTGLQAQQRYFLYRAILVAIVGCTICCKMGYRTHVPV